ncbi:hypothetical protein JOB18_042248 [Solea senegalensis]|uniref:Uncharacterized protein n=1 Tax=Solea senegalensis TaxID=28829 RepID=A0AAV6R9N8_SOLSE|nr:hypothetical protein JOB18_042248 [Solea senegalensis]
MLDVGPRQESKDFCGLADMTEGSLQFCPHLTTAWKDWERQQLNTEPGPGLWLTPPSITQLTSAAQQREFTHSHHSGLIKQTLIMCRS